MHIILTILSIIGIILLVIIGIVILLLFLVLCTPFVYKANVHKDQAIEAGGSVKWLLGVLNVVFSFKDMKADYDIKIFGFSIKKLITGKKDKPKKTKVKKKRKKKKKKNKKHTINPGEKPSKAVIREAKAAADAEIKLKEEAKKPENIKEKIQQKAEEKGIFEEGENLTFTEKLLKIWESLRKNIDVGQKWYKAWQQIKGRVFKIIKHILPKKLKGWMYVGFGDPSLTGKATAVLSVFYGLLPKGLEITPEFEKEVFECDLTLKGRIFLIYLAVHGLKIYFNKEVKIAMNRVKGGK